MSFHRTEFINDVEVRPGAEWTQPARQLSWRIVVRCEAVSPATFSAAVTLNGRELARTEEVASFDGAARRANEMVEDAMARLFET